MFEYLCYEFLIKGKSSELIFCSFLKVGCIYIKCMKIEDLKIGGLVIEANQDFNIIF
jgi:hypothetical protein